MNSVTKGQYFTLIFTTGAFFVFSSQCAKNLSQLVGCIISAVVAAVFIALFSVAAKNKTPNIFINSLVFALLVICGASGIAAFFNAQKNADLGIDHELLCAILLGVAVIYCASLKICAAARAGSVIFALIPLTLALLVIGAFYRLDLSKMDLSFDLSQSFDYSLQSISSTAVIAIAAVLLLKKPQNIPSKHSIAAVLCSFLLSGILSFLAIGASGGENTTYFELAKAAQPFSVQSGEWIYIIIYGMLSVVCLSVIVNLAKNSLKEILPNIRFATTISALSIFVCAHLMSEFSLETKTVLLSTSIGSAIIAVLMLFIKRQKKQRPL